MNTRLRYIIVIIVFSLHACTSNTSIKVNILPELCQVKIGEQVTLALNGQIPANTNIHWEATLGKVVWAEQGLTATFLAPDTPGEAVISVSFVSGTPSPFSASRICTVITETPPPPANVPDAQPSRDLTITISEVMGNPCGGLEARKFNQYVELYNYGEASADVNGWWLYDEGEAGTPDQIVAWSTRSTTRIDAPIILNSTVIPPHGFAIVLSPLYTQSYLAERMPYKFPDGTVILTIAESETLGDDYFGIIGNENGLDTLTLYVGGTAVMDKVVDTYGTPLIKDLYPIHIDDDHLDNLPLYLHECESAERINPMQPDTAANWITLLNGSPGEGPY
jgi:hypothetical protein